MHYNTFHSFLTRSVVQWYALDGNTFAVITGATGGMGKAIAEDLYDRGISLFIVWNMVMIKSISRCSLTLSFMVTVKRSWIRWRQNSLGMVTSKRLYIPLGLTLQILPPMTSLPWKVWKLLLCSLWQAVQPFKQFCKSPWYSHYLNMVFGPVVCQLWPAVIQICRWCYPP